MSLRTVNWHLELVDNMEMFWDRRLTPRLVGLTDDEYLWQPVPNCWTVHSASDGTFSVDLLSWPEPVPPPFTTIAWRMIHLMGVFGERTSHQFGDGKWNDDSLVVPGTAETAIAELTTRFDNWRNPIKELTEQDLARVCSPSENDWSEQPLAKLILHISRELIQHGGEICLLRDLYRDRASLGS